MRTFFAATAGVFFLLCRAIVFVQVSAGEAPSTKAVSVMVASLGGHTADAWAPGSKCIDSTIANKIKCNLGVYESAISRASDEGAKLIALPEAYGIAGTPKDEDNYFEEFTSLLGTNVCENANLSTVSPQQYQLSCFAKMYHIAVAGNVFVQFRNETRRIQEIVFGPNGTVLASYSKIHLFPTEKKWASKGPFRPTSFDYMGRRWGLLVCYDGVYPFVHSDWSELDALKAEGVETIVWSVGSMVPIGMIGGKIARRYNVSMVISEDVSVVTGASHSASILSTDGSPFRSQKDFALQPPTGYRNHGLHIRMATLVV